MITTISDGFLSTRDIPPAEHDYQWAADGIRQCSVEYLHMIADAIQPLRPIEMYPSWDNDKKVQEILDSQMTLSSCTLVYHSWNEIFQDHLYRTIYINSDKQSASLIRSLRKLRPQNARHVRNLTLDCTKSANIWTFVFGVGSMLQNLHNFTVVALNLNITHHFFPRMLFKLPATCKIYFPGIRAKSPSRILRFLKALPPIAQYSPSCPPQPRKIDDLLKSALRTISKFAARSKTFYDWKFCIEEAESALTAVKAAGNGVVEKEFITHLIIAYIIYGQFLTLDGCATLGTQDEFRWKRKGKHDSISMLLATTRILKSYKDWHAEVTTFRHQFPEPLAQLEPLPSDDIARWEIWQLRDVTKEVSSTVPISGDAPLYTSGFNMIPILLMSDSTKQRLIDKLQEHLTRFSGPPEHWRELNQRPLYLLLLTSSFPNTLFVSLDPAVKWRQHHPGIQGMHEGDTVATEEWYIDPSLKMRICSIKRAENIPFHRAVVWQQLKHSSILPFIGLSQDPRGFTTRMIFPWMENGIIKEHIKRLGDVSTARSNRWLKETALGIDYLHKLSLVHGDICSATIFIDEQDHVKISNLGLSDLVSFSSGRNKPYFTLPERQCRKYTVRTRREDDIFSFGCLCIEVYCINLNRIQILQLVNGHWAYPKPPKIPDQIWDLIKSCCQREPSLRPSIQSVIDRLDSFTDV
ncbi:hypothetical protein QCA50_010953 [Cerrena zonata]|uniref:Protein kinase domain-containing protein n=1 Tax=Cerrena zonata TaxID=2478898 RepID=A0AAW0FZF9_9APHY